MRELLAAFALICIALVGKAQVVDYWHTKSEGNINSTSALLLGDSGEVHVIFETRHRGSSDEEKSLPLVYGVKNPILNLLSRRRHHDIISTLDSKGNIDINYVAADSAIINLPVFHDADKTPYAFRHDGKYYFIWFRSFQLGEHFVFNQRLNIGNRYGFQHPLQIVVTDLNFEVLDYKRVYISGGKGIMALTGLMFDKDNHMYIGYKHGYTTDGLEPYDSVVYFEDIPIKQVGYKDGHQRNDYLLKFDSTLSLLDVKLINSTNHSAGEYYGLFHGSPFYNLHFGYHMVHNLPKDSLIIRHLGQDGSLQLKGALATNLSLNQSLKWGSQTVFTGSVFGNADSSFTLGTKSVKRKAPVAGGFAIGSIDASGNADLHTFIDGALPFSIKAYGSQLWLKIQHSGTYYIGNTKVGRSIQTGLTDYIDYLVLDSTLKVISKVEGPSLNAAGSGNGQLVFSGNHIYDVNGFRSKYSLTTDSFQADIDLNNTALNLLYTKTTITPIPLERPDAYSVSLNCHSRRVYFNKTDAEHYTLFISTDSVHPLPNNGSNYNFSGNYQKAPSINKTTKVLYQGPDTSIQITNLIANRKYYVTIVPGNGPAGLTVYNRDSIDTLSFFIPESAYADSIYFRPGKDTFICEGDTINLDAHGYDPVKWMDGVKASSRIFKKPAKYSFTCKAPDGCVISSDTVNVRFRARPEILSLAIAASPPYCKGDTLTLEANATHIYKWYAPDSTGLLEVTQSGVYKLYSKSGPRCIVEDSIEVIFNEKPTFSIIEDTLKTYDGELDVIHYQSSTNNILWYYRDDTTKDYTRISPNESDWLVAQAFARGGCWVKDSIWLIDEESISTAFPNAFSPNGDGLNDVWYFIHPDTTGELTVFDRWGAIVHKGVNQWDGKKHNETLPIGIYHYIYEYENGKNTQGKIILMR